MPPDPASPPPAPADPAGAPPVAAAGDGLGDVFSTEEMRDIADVPSAEIIAAVAVHLMSAAAVKCGLAEEGDDYRDLDEARRLITALAGLITASREYLGVHAAPLRDGLQSLQHAFREASHTPDAPGEGPGEKWTARGR